MRRWLLVGMVSASSLFAGSLELLDVDRKNVEVRLGAVLSIDEKDLGAGDPPVRLAICPDPLADFSSRCVRPMLSTQLPLSSFKHSVGALLFPADASPEETRRREAIVLFSRNQFRKKIERGELDPGTKIKGEALLDELVDASDPHSLTRRRQRAEEWIDTVDEALRDPKRGAAGHLYLRQVESERFEALLAPFVSWFDRSVCRCELETIDGIAESPRCVLRRGKQIMAISRAALGECESRLSCERRQWETPTPAPEKFQFERSVGERCGGFYSLGPVLQRTFKTIPEEKDDKES